MRAVPASAALLAALLVASGCTRSDDSPRAPSTGVAPSVRATSPTPEPTSAPATSVTASASPASLIDRLLPTGLVPGLNAAWKWQEGDTGPAVTDPFGLCAKVDLTSVGAVEVVERTYFPPDDSDDNAAEQIAEFPDTNTAARVWAVLKSWHDKCGRTVSADIGLKAGPLTPVPVTSGSARWYLLSWNPPGEETGRFEAFGMVLDGTRIAVLRMDSSGPDHDYPPGQEPMVGMVRAAAGWLG
jgi:hypothetical protein